MPFEKCPDANLIYNFNSHKFDQKVRFSRSGPAGTSTYDFGESNPPPPVMNSNHTSFLYE